MMKSVSVVIPVKGRKDELHRALQSVTSQSFSDLEVIVVENNSENPEDIKAVVRGFNDPRLKFFSLDNCFNANSARNYGVSLATGDYVCFLDSDDEWLGNHVQNCLDTLLSSDADFVYGGALINDGIKKICRKAWPVNKNAVDYLLGIENGFAPTPSFFVKKKVFQRVLWDETLKRHQDFDFFIRCSFLFKMAVNPHCDVVVNWRFGELRAFSARSVCDFYFKWRSDMSALTERRYIKSIIKLAYFNRARRMAFSFLCYYYLSFIRRL